MNEAETSITFKLQEVQTELEDTTNALSFFSYMTSQLIYHDDQFGDGYDEIIECIKLRFEAAKLTLETIIDETKGA